MASGARIADTCGSALAPKVDIRTVSTLRHLSRISDI